MTQLVQNSFAQWNDRLQNREKVNIFYSQLTTPKNFSECKTQLSSHSKAGVPLSNRYFQHFMKIFVRVVQWKAQLVEAERKKKSFQHGYGIGRSRGIDNVNNIGGFYPSVRVRVYTGSQFWHSFGMSYILLFYNYTLEQTGKR